MAVPSQKLEDFLYALRCCLNDIGGVPHTLVPDNLKSAVIKANRYEPDINRALEDFANHYNTTVTPTRPARPQDKALVENQVKLIYSRVYAKLRHRQFFDLASLNEARSEERRVGKGVDLGGRRNIKKKKTTTEKSADSKENKKR